MPELARMTTEGTANPVWSYSWSSLWLCSLSQWSARLMMIVSAVFQRWTSTVWSWRESPSKAKDVRSPSRRGCSAGYPWKCWTRWRSEYERVQVCVRRSRENECFSNSSLSLSQTQLWEADPDPDSGHTGHHVGTRPHRHRQNRKREDHRLPAAHVSPHIRPAAARRGRRAHLWVSSWSSVLTSSAVRGSRCVTSVFLSVSRDHDPDARAGAADHQRVQEVLQVSGSACGVRVRRHRHQRAGLWVRSASFHLIRRICSNRAFVPQIAELKRGAEIIVCTPGRMIDMLGANNGKCVQQVCSTHAFVSYSFLFSAKERSGFSSASVAQGY